MKHKLSIIIIISILFSIMECKAQELKSVTPKEFEELIADTTVQVLDVRTPEEYAEGHISRAINIDVLNPNFKASAIATLNPQRTVAVYCRSGRRSKQAANVLLNNGFTIIELDKGFLSWVDANLHTTKQ